MLNFRIARSPLSDRENEQILSEYNRLTSGHIPMNEFVRWVQHGPAGPAWHSILETDDGRIVGHTSVFPLRTSVPALIPAKSEYSFMHEDFRSAKIRGLEDVSRPIFIIILDKLFQHCIGEGWGPIFASTREKNQVFTRRVGLRPLEFPLWECLLLLRPLNGSLHTPNLTTRQRAALFAVGLLQSTAWTVSSPLMQPRGIRVAPRISERIDPEGDKLSFFEDADSLEWRYFGDQYVRFSFDDAPRDYLIAKRGGDGRYLRVCQWHLDSAKVLRRLLQALIQEARKERAVGVRWAMYENGDVTEVAVGQMRAAGFLCTQRVRILMVHKQEPQFLETSKWNMNDSLVTFDP